MESKGTIAFDIIDTCFSLELPRQRLIELGTPTYALELWFAQTLRGVTESSKCLSALG